MRLEDWEYCVRDYISIGHRLYVTPTERMVVRFNEALNEDQKSYVIGAIEAVHKEFLLHYWVDDKTLLVATVLSEHLAEAYKALGVTDSPVRFEG